MYKEEVRDSGKSVCRINQKLIGVEEHILCRTTRAGSFLIASPHHWRGLFRWGGLAMEPTTM